MSVYCSKENDVIPVARPEPHVAAEIGLALTFEDCRAGRAFERLSTSGVVACPVIRDTSGIRRVNEP
jgi:hypothetical protein